MANIPFLNNAYFSAKVGIGTDSPGAKLDVSGDVLIDSGEYLSWGTVGATSIEGSTASNKLQFRTSSTDRMIINDTGVGIGTTSPAVKLDVSNGIARTVDTKTYSTFVHSKDSDDYRIGLVTAVKGGATSSDRYVSLEGSSYQISTDTFTNEIDLVLNPTSGNVGIGTTSPDLKLDVTHATSGEYVATFQNTAANLELKLGVTSTNYLNIQGQQINNSAAFNMSLQADGGNVGIGTTVPSAKLEIVDTSNPGSTSGSVIIEGRRDGSPNVLTLRAKDASTPAGALPNGQGPVVRFQGFDGTDFENMGYIQVAADGQAVANGDAPSFMAFGTSADSSSSPTERMRIDSAGALRLNTYGAGTLVSDASGNITVSSGGGAGGPYLPLSGGTMTGNIVLSDNDELRVGVDGDLRLYHNGTNNFILNTIGNLNIRQTADDGNITFQSDDGSGGYTNYFIIDGGNAQTQVYKDFRFQDSVKAKFGNSSDLSISHDGTDSFIEDSGTGSLYVTTNAFRLLNPAENEQIITAFENGAVNLFYDSSKKFETTGTGVTVTGDIQIDSALLSNQENTDVDTGTETVASVAIATYTAAFFDFVVKKGTNVRSGTVYACHDGTNVEFTETSTNDLGNTSDVTLSVDISGTNMRLLATVTSDDWSVKSLIRAI